MITLTKYNSCPAGKDCDVTSELCKQCENFINMEWGSHGPEGAYFVNCKFEIPSNWWTMHHKNCGTKYRGCDPHLCAKHHYEQTGVWLYPEELEKR